MGAYDFRVQPRDQPSGSGRDATLTRLARHVAVLFGVDVPNNPYGLTWVSDFASVNLSAVARGAPVRGRPAHLMALADRTLVETAHGNAQTVFDVKDPRYREIPAATLNSFGPDTKAAAILAGANELFASVAEIFPDVLQVVGELEDGAKLADLSRVAVWAALLLELYRSQPALFVAALQARAVQRGISVGWHPMIPDDLSVFARTEYEQGEPRTYSELDTVTSPTTLYVLDQTLRIDVQPTLTLPEGAHDLQAESNEYLIDGLIGRLAQFLTQSADQGVAIVVDEGYGRRSVDAYVPAVSIVSALVDTLLKSSAVVPYGQPDGDPVALDMTEESHWRRLLPRTPQLPELRRLDTRSQSALICGVGIVDRALLQISNLPDPFIVAILDNLRQLSELSDRVLGRESPISMVARNRWASSRSRRFGADAEAAATQMTTLESLSDLRRSGMLTRGEWAATLSDNSVAMNARYRSLIDSHQTEAAADLFRTLDRYWGEVFDSLGVDLDEEMAYARDHGHPRRRTMMVSGLLHNYLGFKSRDPDPDEALRAIRLGLDLVIPIRATVYRQRRTGGAYRTSVQVVLRAIDRLLTGQVGDEHRPALLRDCARLVEILCASPDWQRIVSTRELIGGSDVTVLASVLCGWNALAEGGIRPAPPELEEFSSLLATWMRIDTDDPRRHATISAGFARTIVQRSMSNADRR